MKRILLIFVAILMVFSLYACDVPEDAELKLEDCYSHALPTAEGRTLFVQFKMSCGATFVVELYPEYAPQTVERFQDLVQEGFYNGLTFHRICANYMIQGGAGTDASQNPLYGEFSTNGFSQNTLSHERGVISMARRSDDPDSAGTQFFIMHATNTRLDGDYAAFGKVVAGMETVDAIAKLPVKEQTYSAEKSKPVVAPVIESVTFVNFIAEPAQ